MNSDRFVRRLSWVFLLALACAPLAGCGDFERGKPLPVDVDEGLDGDENGDGADNGGAPAVVFADVRPVLDQRCGQCHGPNSGTAFALPAGDEAAYDEVLGYVSPGDAAASPLLTKADGTASHGGGVVLSPGSPDHRLIGGWIADGAPFEAVDED